MSLTYRMLQPVSLRPIDLSPAAGLGAFTPIRLTPHQPMEAERALAQGPTAEALYPCKSMGVLSLFSLHPMACTRVVFFRHPQQKLVNFFF